MNTYRGRREPCVQCLLYDRVDPCKTEMLWTRTERPMTTNDGQTRFDRGPLSNDAEEEVLEDRGGMMRLVLCKGDCG